MVSNVISYARRGSIISIQYHMIQPDLPDGSGFDAMNIPGSGYSKLDQILTEDSELNKVLRVGWMNLPVISRLCRTVELQFFSDRTTK